ncbi:NAD/ferredoxin-dependent reductase-like protein [Nocardioides albertanoniae]|uniref:NAD/ferredoxin-dependent reductase-like protein n=1 Tax=Nocardioides albertanoniae TaxID=1175486 RepID=A0A543A0Z7_9ACTN|nr:FAD-dependent oxidoreductase [Nocardioides albertanoniae]TQL66272.1 NAD/ferredoxin-dependent reductase-like protein [Nocardioides albertanoniae]
MVASSVASVVVVGGGIAGVSTVTELRKNGYAGGLTLLTADPFPYDRPPLSKAYLSGAKDLESIALQAPEWYAGQRIDVIRGLAAALDPAAGTVTLSDGRQLSADRIVLATGGWPLWPDIERVVRGLLDRPPAGSGIPRSTTGIHLLRSAEDADGLRAVLLPGARLLVVGAGLIGAEVTSTARKLGCEVVLVDPANPPIAAAVGAQVAEWLHSLHALHGAETVTATVEKVESTNAGVVAQIAGEASPRTFDAVLLAVGMVPDTAMAKEAGLDVDNGVVVDDHQVTSHPTVLAVGDCARRQGHRRAEHWEAAVHDGARAAATILGVDAPAASAPWFWTDRYDLHVEVVGEMHEPEGEHEQVVRGTLGEPPFTVFTLRGERVVGAVAVDDPKAVRAARRMIDRGVDVRAADLADPSTDLRQLLRSAR